MGQDPYRGDRSMYHGIELMFRGAYELRISREGHYRRRLGNIIHLTLSQVHYEKDLKYLPRYLERALALLGEKTDQKEALLQRIERIFTLPKSKKFFPAWAEKVLTERDLLVPSKKTNRLILRPDRVVLFPDHAVVVDFKSEPDPPPESREKYLQQVKSYVSVVERLFHRPTEGYLLFVLGPKVEKVV